MLPPTLEGGVQGVGIGSLHTTAAAAEAAVVRQHASHCDTQSAPLVNNVDQLQVGATAAHKQQELSVNTLPKRARPAVSKPVVTSCPQHPRPPQ
jgi:hypothetical protein